MGLSVDCPRPWTFHGHSRVLNQSGNWPRTRLRPGSVRVPGMAAQCPRNGPGKGRDCPCIVPAAMAAHVPVFSWVSPRVGFTKVRATSSFDPSSVRAAVARFTPGCPLRFQALSPAKDIIPEQPELRDCSNASAEAASDCVEIRWRGEKCGLPSATLLNETFKSLVSRSHAAANTISG